MKKLFAILLAVALVLSFAACGGNTKMTAEEVYLAAAENTNGKAYTMSGTAKVGLGMQGATMDMDVAFDMAMDEAGNISMVMNMSAVGMSFPMEMYLINGEESAQLYLGVMGEWMVTESPAVDLETMTADPSEIMQYYTIEDLGSEKGIRTLKLTVSPDILDAAGELDEETSAMLPQLKAAFGDGLVMTVTIDEDALTFQTITADFTEFMAAFFALMGEEATAGMTVTSATMDFAFDYDAVSEITLPEAALSATPAV